MPFYSGPWKIDELVQVQDYFLKQSALLELLIVTKYTYLIVHENCYWALTF